MCALQDSSRPGLGPQVLLPGLVSALVSIRIQHISNLLLCLEQELFELESLLGISSVGSCLVALL